LHLLAQTFRDRRPVFLPVASKRMRGVTFVGLPTGRLGVERIDLYQFHWPDETGILVWPGVSRAIGGARTPQQVDGWIEASSITLTPPDLAEIASAIRRTRAGAGPVEHGKSRARGQRAA
jgi:hypothetical protein